MKKYIVALLFTFFTLILVSSAQAEVGGINIYLFHRDDCPHCHEEQEFLEGLKEDNPNINIIKNEVIKSKEGQEMYVKTVERLNVERSGVPLLVIGDEYIVGFKNEKTTGLKIKELISRYSVSDCRNEVDFLKDYQHENCLIGDTCSENKSCELGVPLIEKIPLLGEVNLKSFSLPVLTFIIAVTDGFNPCAMWVLLFLISLLLGMKDRKRMWLLGGVFILTSGFVYFLFLAAWLELVMFIGAILWVQIIIASIALLSGFFHLRQWWKNKESVCKVTGSKKRQKVFEKIKKVIKEKSLFFAVVGIVILAFAVNLVELVCSAGLPAVYTQVLVSASLTTWEYYAYLFFYILIFMLDDMVVFAIAMKTLELKGISTKYTKYANLVGGIVIFLIGIYLTLKII